MGVKLYTPTFVLVMWLVAAESPINMFFQGNLAPFPSDKSFLIFARISWDVVMISRCFQF